jgi:hypothetical protein
MTTRLGDAYGDVRVRTARREHGHGVDVLHREQVVERLEPGHAVFLAVGAGARFFRVANGGESGGGDLTGAEQLGMTLGDSAAADDGESDHSW